MFLALGHVVGLNLQQGHHAFGEVVEFLDAGAEILMNAVVELAAIAVIPGFEYHEVAAVFFPVHHRADIEFTGIGIQPQLAVAELGLHCFVITLRQRGMDGPQFTFREIGDLAHDDYRAQLLRRAG